MVSGIFEGTDVGTIGEYWVRAAPSGKPLPGGCKSRGKSRFNSTHDNKPLTKLMFAPIARSVGSPRTLRKLTSCPKAKERTKGHLPVTKYGVL